MANYKYENVPKKKFWENVCFIVVWWSVKSWGVCWLTFGLLFFHCTFVIFLILETFFNQLIIFLNFCFFIKPVFKNQTEVTQLDAVVLIDHNYSFKWRAHLFSEMKKVSKNNLYLFFIYGTFFQCLWLSFWCNTIQNNDNKDKAIFTKSLRLYMLQISISLSCPHHNKILYYQVSSNVRKVKFAQSWRQFIWLMKLWKQMKAFKVRCFFVLPPVKCT